MNIVELDHLVLTVKNIPTPESGDLCLISDTAMDQIIAELSNNKVKVTTGPLKKRGANGPITSVYVRDRDQNLIEISNYN
ncbi:hypothetical protein [Companilactobacillus ginsenosidimutans]|uniref:hypothetical protein n=1 Tax=Companilactobacillus ginsenosidimutans TaxID=1007676 RepID=UPI00069D2D0F|nr:hypothetical protein [Companilactobacillus ginsenosidimutans]